ncbi:MAG: uroporphyrinogen-III C-methyltransferase [Gammaproteobacteria bacterium]|nr:MAG: uroporphyrinogen-III C-methyltransferase [Gammaproteobacteria bacterium]
MKYLPLFLLTSERPALVAGAGRVARRKAEFVLRAGQRVRMVAPGPFPAALHWARARGMLEYRQGNVEEADLEGVGLVFAATDDREVNARLARWARQRGLHVNVADRPEEGTFIVPSVLDRDPVLVAVSTGGTSPVLARRLRARLESLIPSAYGRLARLLDAYRERARARIPDEAARRRFWEALIDGPVSELVFAGQEARARLEIETALERAQGARPEGEVYLVGAGPGDPDLLTFRALRLMQQADVVVYDRLVSKPILEMTRQDAELYYVGKQKDDHAVPQEGINQMLVDLARQGKRVLRLKGGDPFVFGRGGEEIETLAEHGIPFQVVPGITAASGCAAYAGIPLTHRDYAQSCIFVTGHLKDGSLDLNWEALVQPRQTVVFYMGLTGIGVISERLIAHGMSPDMPAALVEQGTTPNQRVLIGTVATLPEIVHRAEVRAPTLTIVGEVVRLHEKLEWYQAEEHRPGTVFSSH